MVTRAGRVVYNRRPTPFSWCDVWRIVRSLSPRFSSTKELDCWKAVGEAFLDQISAAAADFGVFSPEMEEATNRIRELTQSITFGIEEFHGQFSGGSAGGAGASRTWPEPDPVEFDDPG